MQKDVKNSPDGAETAPATAQTAAQAQAHTFIAKWQGSTATELASAQTFVAELCELLQLPKPDPAGDGSYTYEKPLTQALGDGSTAARRIDCYKRGCFVLEAKKLRSQSGKGFDMALLQARAQAENYARALPATEGRPPFLIVVDVGHVFELYAEFSRTGGTYTPFPDPRHHRLPLQSLADPATRELLRAVWTAPDTLDPAKRSARVTREVSDALAGLAKSLELDGHAPKDVAAFLTRCLFSMFAEDVELLPKGAFLGLLEQHIAEPDTLLHLMRALWTDMDLGGFSVVLHQKLLKFNGKLFKSPQSTGYVLPLKAAQAAQLIAAARCNWREVEPAIFGTLLERALSSTERHALGAHYTPRAYVERLVWPTVIAPLRQDWAYAQAAALVLAADGKLDAARSEVLAFHAKLCHTTVLDPACGSGNFLYVTLELMKRLEGEVLNQLHAFGDVRDQQASLLTAESVGLQQFLGLELNERAAALADLVLWIGYLQWQIRTRGNRAVAEPVVHDYGNIRCTDAVLDWDDTEPAYDSNGHLLTRWDGTTRKTHPVTLELVPDEEAVIPQWQYIRPRKAVWPQADFIVGNPPFIGNKRMREALGDGYAMALRQTWPEVPESADFVMYWWAQAAALAASGKLRRFGLITTNSITMIFNRRVVQNAADRGVGIVFAVPDHPWVDNVNGAAVRIAMTVGQRAAVEGVLCRSVNEVSSDYGEMLVDLQEAAGAISADLRVGANVGLAAKLQANAGLSNRGVIPHGAGFSITAEQAAGMGLGTVAGLERHIRPYRNGKDLTDSPRGVLVIDLYGLNAEEVRSRFPAVYQWLLVNVKPERDANRDFDLREKWWLHRRNNEVMRDSLSFLTRYIATGQVAKHPRLPVSRLRNPSRRQINCNRTPRRGQPWHSVQLAAHPLGAGGRRSAWCWQ